MPPRLRTKTGDAGFYEARLASRLARLPLSTLGFWVSEGIAAPSQQLLDATGTVIEVGFSFSDVAYLRILRHLRERGVPMENAVEAMVHLRDRFGEPGPSWRKAKVYVVGKRIFGYYPDQWGTTMTARKGGGQKIEERVFGDLFEELGEAADSILVPPQFIQNVEITPRVASGLPVIRGTRLPTSAIKDLVDQRKSERIVRNIYPELTLSQIRDAVAFELFLDEAPRRAA